jgi:histidyl-tRNA synthetase
LLKEADAVGARYAVLLDDDVAGGAVQLKDLSAGGQEPVAIKAVADLIRNRESAQG